MSDEVCTCGPDVRCVECGGCECVDNPGTCEPPGCMSVSEYLLNAEEFGWSGDSYGLGIGDDR